MAASKRIYASLRFVMLCEKGMARLKISFRIILSCCFTAWIIFQAINSIFHVAICGRLFNFARAFFMLARTGDNLFSIWFESFIFLHGMLPIVFSIDAFSSLHMLDEISTSTSFITIGALNFASALRIFTSSASGFISGRITRVFGELIDRLTFITDFASLARHCLFYSTTYYASLLFKPFTLWQNWLVV